VLEVGCAEAGFLDALHERGIRAVGLELEPHRVALAKAMNPNLELRVGDITNSNTVSRIAMKFDLAVMRDVIEHVPEKEAAFRNLGNLLKPRGFLYVTFPPRFSPFGGHHQNGRSVLKKLPFLHLLPSAAIRFFGRLAHEHPHIIENTISNYRVGLSIRQFESLCEKTGFRMRIKELYLFRPVYRTRLGIKPRRLPDVPLFREFITFGCECLLQRTS
jgi:SAM-dependent methyltransferase